MAIFREVETTVYCDVCGEYVIGWRSKGQGISRARAAYHARKEGCTTGKKVICKKCRISRRIEKCSLQNGGERQAGTATALVWDMAKSLTTSL